MSTYAPRTGAAAAKTAAAKVGHSNRVGMCLAEVAAVFGVGGVGDYDGDGHATALDYWKKAVAKGKVVKTSDPAKIPAGAMVFWDTHYGHVAVGAGGGKVYSTDRPTNGKWGHVTINSINTAWGKHLLGYVLVDGNGVTLTDASTSYKVTARVAEYTVDVKPGTVLNGRGAPGGKITTTIKGGTTFTSKGYTTIGGALSIQRSDGIWFAGAYLNLVAKPKPQPKPTPKPVPAPKPTPAPVGPLLRVATQNLAIGNPTGKKSWKTRIPKAAKQITSKNVDVFNGQESGTGPDLDVLSKALAPGLILAPGGSDWRHIFYNPKTVKRVASGFAQITPLLDGDTKQFAWLVGIRDGKRFLDVCLHLESAKGPAADTIRVKQMANVLAQSTALAGQHGVDISNVILAGDTNSANQVRQFMESKGWASAAKEAKSALSATLATFNGWATPLAGNHIDYTFNLAGTEIPLWVQWPDPDLSDHNLQASDRRLV